MEQKVLSDVVGRVTTLESQVEEKPVAKKQDWTSPFWSCEMLISATVAGLGAADWDTAFDDPMNERINFEIPSPSGYLFTLIGNSVVKPVRCRYQFDCDAPFSVPATLYADNWGRVQIKVNGELSNYTAATDLTFNFGAGRNLVQVSGSEVLDKIELYIQMIDRVNARWSNPTALASSRIWKEING